MMLDLVLCAMLAQGEPKAAPSVPRAGQTAQQDLLRRDPRRLPRSLPGAWSGFDPARLTEETLPAEIGTVTRAIVAGDMPGALAGLYALLDRVHEFPPALHMMGIVYFRLQRYGDSAVLLARYVELVPARVGDTRVLGHDLYTLGFYEQARAHYERVVAVAAQDAEAWRGLALSTWRLGEASKALELLERVIELEQQSGPEPSGDSRKGEAWAWKAQILFDEGRNEDALAAAKRACAEDAFESRAWFVMGQALGEMGRAEEADAARARFHVLVSAAQEVRALEGRLLYQPRDVGLIDGLVAVHARTGNAARARAWLSRLVKQRPDDVTLRVRALDVLDRLDDRNGAQVAARELEARASDELPAWERLADFYAKSGDAEGASRAQATLRRLGGR